MKIQTTKLILVPPIDFHILVITFYYTVIVFCYFNTKQM